MRLIDADALIEKYQKETGIDVYRNDVLQDLEEAPTMDCKNCKYANYDMSEGDFFPEDLGVMFRIAVHNLQYHAQEYNELVKDYYESLMLYFDRDGDYMFPFHSREEISALGEEIDRWKKIITDDLEKVEKLRKLKEDSCDETHD